MNKISLSEIFKKIKFSYAWRIAIFYIIRKLLHLSQFKIYFSQLGEDIILLNLLDHKPRGFYIDVGCNEPIQYNNTFYFYLRGWSGINIDANEALIKKFDQIRHEDTNVCAAISNEVKEIRYFKSSKNPEVNTTDYSDYLRSKESWEFDENDTIYTQRLDTILERYIQPDQKIDFLSIDVQGSEINVLKSVDFDNYRPNIIVIELQFLDLTKFYENEICKYLEAHGYMFIGYIDINAYFRNSRNK